ncbi:MAG TPA: hypothetical protein VFF31_27965 [Blastocatellia bacterium]|nr:hypothetical protein [Blastocatellia bacterium]
MKSNLRFTVNALLVLVAVCVASAYPQEKGKPKDPAEKQSAQMQIAAGGNQAVQGNGTIGRLAKWTALKNIGDSIVFESSNGLVGIGTDTPTSKLTVQGMIQTTMGGYKFPDGTVQTSAGLQFVNRDSTLSGNGTQNDYLRVAVPLFLTATQDSITALDVRGGDLSAQQGFGGSGLSARGGDAKNPFGGIAGIGLTGIGGNATGVASAGIGVSARGGAGGEGIGLLVEGGDPLVGFGGSGGDGARIFGGDGRGVSHQGGDGIRVFAGAGTNGATPGNAGSFFGTVDVAGNFNVIAGGTKNFKIDHPLDPENKYLYHAAIESSEVLNIYSGNVTTDESGEAVVTLPDWFEAINRDFRYQLTVVGTFAQAIVGEKIKSNRFQIKTSAPGIEVSWQVTGIRSDAAIRKHPFTVEADKANDERGLYLSPEAYDQPQEKGIQWARDPRNNKSNQRPATDNR